MVIALAGGTISMGSILTVVITATRFLVGVFLLALGATCALRCSKEIAGLPPETAADIITDILLIVLGLVGLRMLTSLLRPTRAAAS